tara:strand:+ start:1567 stop:2022 length:456 start_codon:yes stop_codon:yes gene_type:complete
MNDLNFNLKILNQKKHIIYFFESKIDPSTGEAFQPSNNDIHMWKIMTNNFIENCKSKNSKFGFIFNLHTVSSLPLKLILDICGFFIKHNSFLKKNLIANCFIMENNKLQNFIDLFLKYYKPVRPIKFFNNIDDCKKYIHDSFVCNESFIDN